MTETMSVQSQLGQNKCSLGLLSQPAYHCQAKYDDDGDTVTVNQSVCSV